MDFIGLLSNILAGLIVTFIVCVYKHLRGSGLPLRRILIIFLIFLVSICATDFTPMPVGETIRVLLFGPPSFNERLTRDAWKAFEREAYHAAISSAEEMIKKYDKPAMLKQVELEREKEKDAPHGKVWPRPAAKIFDRGILNDVAACYWIMGKCYERINLCHKAKEAYLAASKLTYARVWDSQWWPLRGWSPFGWFWSPAQDAQDRLEKLSCS